MPEWEQSVEVKAMTGQQVLVAATMTESELAKALNVPQSTIRNLRYAGEIPFVQVSRGRPIYLVDSILGWLKSRESREWESGPRKTTGDMLAHSQE